MKRRLPPLNALRAFEAAARHGGFVAAANELGVTPAAVSHQIKGLEEALGLQLFERQRRSVTLTPAGQALLPGLTEAFDQMVRTVETVRRRMSEDRPLVVATSPSFAAKWLMPRLPAFLEAHPELTVRVETESAPGDLEAGDADLAVRCCRSDDPALANLRVDRLFADRLFPVCAPVLRMAVRTPTNLTTQVLIHDHAADSGRRSPDGVIFGWAEWLEAAGVPTLRPRGDLCFSHVTMALDAAVRGQGVALGRGALVVGELKAGTLVRPFEKTVESAAPYCLLRPSGRSARPAVGLLRDWLMAESARFLEAEKQIVC